MGGEGYGDRDLPAEGRPAAGIVNPQNYLRECRKRQGIKIRPFRGRGPFRLTRTSAVFGGGSHRLMATSLSWRLTSPRVVAILRLHQRRGRATHGPFDGTASDPLRGRLSFPGIFNQYIFGGHVKHDRAPIPSYDAKNFLVPQCHAGTAVPYRKYLRRRNGWHDNVSGYMRAAQYFAQHRGFEFRMIGTQENLWLGATCLEPRSARPSRPLRAPRAPAVAIGARPPGPAPRSPWPGALDRFGHVRVAPGWRSRSSRRCRSSAAACHSPPGRAPGPGRGRQASLAARNATIRSAASTARREACTMSSPSSSGSALKPGGT